MKMSVNLRERVNVVVDGKAAVGVCCIPRDFDHRDLGISIEDAAILRVAFDNCDCGSLTMEGARAILDLDDDARYTTLSAEEMDFAAGVQVRQQPAVAVTEDDDDDDDDEDDEPNERLARHEQAQAYHDDWQRQRRQE